MKTSLELKTIDSDIIINYQLCKQLKLLENNKFNYLIIILTLFSDYV